MIRFSDMTSVQASYTFTTSYMRSRSYFHVFGGLSPLRTFAEGHGNPLPGEERKNCNPSKNASLQNCIPLMRFL